LKAKYLHFTEFGNPREVLKIAHKNIHPPKDNNILVRMIARPINPSDLIPIRGAYSHRIPLPNVPGYEGVGIVEDVGPSAPHHLLGKRVLPLRGDGTWQEFVTTSADLAIEIPDSIDDVIDAQMYINPVTAWVICTEELKLAHGDTLLVNACGSAIGHIFAQLSNILGFRLIAVTRNDTHTKQLKNLGASYVINTAGEPLYETVMELTNGTGATTAIDSIGGADGNELVFSVRPKGTYLTLGLLSGVQVDWGKITNEANVNIRLFHLRHWNDKISVHTWQETFQQLITLIQEEKLKLMQPQSYFDLTKIDEAVRMVESKKGNQGKVMLTN